MYIFNGIEEANRRKAALTQMVKRMPQITVFALVFREDIASIKYTKLKKKDAEEIGILYKDLVVPVSIPIEQLKEILIKENSDKNVSGIIIQKPTKNLMPSTSWWESLVSCISQKKDIDGLTKDSLVVPATARAVLEILRIALTVLDKQEKDLFVVVMGKSDIVGMPVYKELLGRVKEIHQFGSKDDQSHVTHALKQAGVVISATGVQNLLQPDQLKQSVIVIDAGSPKPEVNPDGLELVASFLSPVPGGVGPMTRVCLLENTLNLVQSSYY